MTAWLPAFRTWFRQWRRHPMEPEWYAAHAKAFRAGFRAGLRAAKGQPRDPRGPQDSATFPSA